MKIAFFLPLSAGILSFLSACQNQDEPSEAPLDQPTVSVTATIDPLSPSGRYVQENESSPAHFDQGDQIGLFMDNQPAQLWSYSNLSWSTEQPVYWPDINQMHTFKAYYPCEKPVASSQDNIPMPALSSQNGTWNDMHRYDFLVASHEVGYTSNHGNVSFSGSHSFKHIFTLLKIVIKATDDLQGTTLTDLSVEGTHLFSKCTYSFTTRQVSVLEHLSAQNTLTLHPAQKINAQDAVFYLVVNGKSEATGPQSTFSLKLRYTTSNGTTHTAQQKDIPCQLLSGNSYRFDLQIKGGNLIITGGEISDWTAGNGAGEEITLNSEEETQDHH